MPAAIWPIELEEDAAFSLPVRRRIAGAYVSVADFTGKFTIYDDADGTVLYEGTPDNGVMVFEPAGADETPVTGLISIVLTKQQVNSPAQAWKKGVYTLEIWPTSDTTGESTIRLLEGPARWDPKAS